jgi:hypothetical protein
MKDAILLRVPRNSLDWVVEIGEAKSSRRRLTQLFAR